MIGTPDALQSDFRKRDELEKNVVSELLNIVRDRRLPSPIPPNKNEILDN
jgi:hypothetical protein